MKLVTPQDSPRRNVLLYGPPKSGKTVGACSAPDPILLLNLDQPNSSWFAHRIRRNALVEIGYESFTETLVGIAGSLHQGDLTFGGLSKEPIQTIVVDPIGGLYQRLLDEFSHDAVSPSLPNYQTTQVHLERFCRFLCENRDVNFVMTAHEYPVENEATGEVEKLLWAGTKSNSQHMTQKLMGMVDIVGYAAAVQQEGGSVEYLAQLVNGKGRRGGDRFGDLLAPGETVRPINLTEWFLGSKVQEERKAA